MGAEGARRTHVFRGQSRFVQRGQSPGSLSHLRPMEPEEVWKPRAGRIVRSGYSRVSLMTLGPRACEAKAIDCWTARGSLTCGHQVAADSWPGWVRTPKPDKGARWPRGTQASCMGWSFQKPVVGRWARGVLQGPQGSVTYWLLLVKAVDCLPGGLRHGAPAGRGGDDHGWEIKGKGARPPPQVAISCSNNIKKSNSHSDSHVGKSQEVASE